MTALSLWQLFVSHLLILGGLSLGAVLVLHLLADRRPSGSTVAWLLAIIFIPYVAVPFYVVFGGRKLKRSAARKNQLYPGAPGVLPDSGIARMLCASGAPPPRDGNAMEVLATGEAAFAALTETIESAQRSIQLSTLILADDEVGRDIVARLERKAAAGVEVRVLLDALFLGLGGRGRLARLRKRGVHVSSFMPIAHLPFRGHANLRLHRKIVSTDGTCAIVGGMNLAREYIGPQPFAGRWRDLSVRIRGPVVADIDSIFEADWSFATHEAPATKPAREASAAVGPTTIQAVGSGPDSASDLIYDAFLSAVFEARRRLWMATPYFVPDEGLARALLLAVRRGVDVRIVVPARSNHLLADLTGAGYLRELSASGARIGAFAPGMMHAKAIVVDDTFASVGSANLDMRSLFLDYEIALFLSAPSDVETVAAWFSALFPSCGELRPPGRGRATLERVARLLGPLV